MKDYAELVAVAELGLFYMKEALAECRDPQTAEDIEADIERTAQALPPIDGDA